jgi:hypothetical protein
MPYIREGVRVTVIKKSVYHLTSHTRMQWKEGEVVKVITGSTTTIHVRFPPGTIRGFPKTSPVLHLSPDVIIPSYMVPAYKSGVAKLNEEERIALRV